MNPDSENFDQLRRLLALKRHEQPPPGFWENFSSRVVARIEAGERVRPDSLGERILGEFSFLQRFWAVLEAKPVLAGAFGVTVCGLLISGVLYSEDAAPGTALISPGSLPVSSVVNHSDLALSQPLESQVASSTNPAPDIGSLFNQAQLQISPQMVSFPALPSPGGN